MAVRDLLIAVRDSFNLFWNCKSTPDGKAGSVIYLSSYIDDIS